MPELAPKPRTRLSLQITCRAAASGCRAGAWADARARGPDRTAYAIHPLPLSEVRALRRHTPALGGQHIVLVLGSGLTLPPLTFSAGGVKAFFAALKQARLPRPGCLCESVPGNHACARPGYRVRVMPSTLQASDAQYESVSPIESMLPQRVMRAAWAVWHHPDAGERSARDYVETCP